MSLTEKLPVIEAVGIVMPTIDEIVDVTKLGGIVERFRGPQFKLAEPLELQGMVYTHVRTETALTDQDEPENQTDLTRFTPKVSFQLCLANTEKLEEPEDGLITTIKFAPFGLSRAYFEDADIPLPPLKPQHFGVWEGNFYDENSRSALVSGDLGSNIEKTPRAALAAETLLAAHNTMQTLGYEAMRREYVHVSPVH